MGNNLENKKSIVYLTINMINWHIYVGVHDIDPNNPWDFYLGNGIYANRPSCLNHPKEPFHFAVKKYGFSAFKRFTLATFDTRKEALALERIIVNEEFIARSDTYNITLGGGDPPRNDRACYQYTLDGTFVQKYNNLTEAAISLGFNSINSIINAIEFKIRSGNYFWTDYYVEKLDLSQFTNTTQARMIHMYNRNGSFEQSFDSIMDAVRFVGSNLGVVQRAVKTQTMVHGHYFCFEKVDTFQKIKTRKHYADSVHQYSLSGEYIKSYNSVSEVVKQLGKVYRQIPSSIRLGGTCGNYQWSWDKLSRLPNKEKNVAKARKIGQYTLDGVLVKTYDTLRACRKDFGNVGKVLKGQAMNAKGYTFKYLD